MRRILATFIALVSGWAVLPAVARAEPFPQLISTQYEKGAALPDGARRPAAAVGDVDRSRLPRGAKVRATARSASGRTWVLTDQGPFRSTAGGIRTAGSRAASARAGPARREHLGARITDLAADPVGHIWVATDQGRLSSPTAKSGGKSWVGTTASRIETIHCLHLAPNGDLWAGTPEGAWRLRDGQFRYFWGRRWLPDNDVRAIWTDAGGPRLDRDADRRRLHRGAADDPGPKGRALRPDHPGAPQPPRLHRRHRPEDARRPDEGGDLRAQRQRRPVDRVLRRGDGAPIRGDEGPGGPRAGPQVDERRCSTSSDSRAFPASRRAPW